MWSISVEGVFVILVTPFIICVNEFQFAKFSKNNF